MIRLLLALVMCLTLVTPSLATEISNNNNDFYKILVENHFEIPKDHIFNSISDAPVVSDTTKSTERSYAYGLGSNLIMVTEDQANGDALISLIQDGTLVSSSFLNRNAATVVHTDFATNTVTTTQIPQQSITLNDLGSSARVSYSYQGKIRYQYTYGTTSLCGANIYANFYTNPGERYNLNGTYKDITGFAAYICGVLAVPATWGSPIAGGILTALGIALGTGSYFIPAYYVRCTRTTNDWKFTDSANSSNYYTVSGSEFYITGDKNFGQTYHEGDYFDKYSYSSHNRSFAGYVYSQLFTYTIWSIYDWS